MSWVVEHRDVADQNQPSADRGGAVVEVDVPTGESKGLGPASWQASGKRHTLLEWRRHSVRHDGFTTAGPSPRPSRTRHPRPSGPPRVDQQLPELSGRDAQYSPIRSARSRSRRYTVAGDRPSLSKTHAAGSRSTRSRMRRTDFVVFKRTTGWPLSAQVLMKQ